MSCTTDTWTIFFCVSAFFFSSPHTTFIQKTEKREKKASLSFLSFFFVVVVVCLTIQQHAAQKIVEKNEENKHKTNTYTISRISFLLAAAAAFFEKEKKNQGFILFVCATAFVYTCTRHIPSLIFFHHNIFISFFRATGPIRCVLFYLSYNRISRERGWWWWWNKKKKIHVYMRVYINSGIASNNNNNINCE